MFVAWALACVAGFGVLWHYKAKPGDRGDPPARWPAGVALERSADAPTLVMIAHPRCPCTRASLDELAEVLRGAPPRVTAYVLFALPDGVDADWEQGELHDRARRIPGVRVVDDRGSAIARRLGVSVSGHVLVYDADGDLRFSGGITGARGHRGDNLGRARVSAIVRGGAADHHTAHVFGCSIKDPS